MAASLFIRILFRWNKKGECQRIPLAKKPLAFFVGEPLYYSVIFYDIRKVRSLSRLESTSPGKVSIAPKKNAKLAFFTIPWCNFL